MNLKQAIEVIEEGFKDLIDTCPHCDAKVHIENLWSQYHGFSNGAIEFYVVFRCKPCKKLVLKTYLFSHNPYSDSGDLTASGWGDKYPIALEMDLNLKDTEYIPEQTFADYKEALKCKSIGANRASCSMFRRALQNGLQQLGASAKVDLIDQIKSLPNLPDDIKDWAHQIRILGNWGAHPDSDNLKEVDEEDVVEVQDFVSKFFTYMFVMPEKVKISRKKREEKISEKA